MEILFLYDIEKSYVNAGMPEKSSQASEFLPVVSCLCPALAFRHQGLVWYRLFTDYYGIVQLCCLPMHLNISPPASISSSLNAYLPAERTVCLQPEYLPAWPTFACLNIFMPTWTFSCPPEWISTCLPASLLACLNIYLPASISACLPEYLPAC